MTLGDLLHRRRLAGRVIDGETVQYSAGIRVRNHGDEIVPYDCDDAALASIDPSKSIEDVQHELDLVQLDLMRHE